MASQADLVNNALLLLGVTNFVSSGDLTAATIKTAKAAVKAWDITRDECLRAHPWKFAKNRVALTATTTPIFEWTYAFSLPNDSLRIIGTEYDDYPDVKWTIEGQTLLTHESSIKVTYIKQVTDTTKWDSTFSAYFVAKLAQVLAYAILQSSTKADEMEKLADKRLKLARSVNAQEGTAPEIVANRLIDSRFTGIRSD